jgi:hypothetical protein
VPLHRTDLAIRNHGVDGGAREISIQHSVAIKEEHERSGRATITRVLSNRCRWPFRVHDDNLCIVQSR